jgi:hypothetical protein
VHTFRTGDGGGEAFLLRETLLCCEASVGVGSVLLVVVGLFFALLIVALGK